MRFTLSALLVLILAAAAAAGADGVYRTQFTLKSPRTRDPVLGGPRDKVVVTVWIPDGVKNVRGGICNPFSKGDAVSGHWQAACRLWKFAYVQVDFDAVKKEEFGLLAQGLTELAKTSGHPELEHLPLCFTGMSRGGGMSMQLAELMPQRTIACAPVCLEVGPTTPATHAIPVATIFGEKDGRQLPLLLEKLPVQRQQDARWAIAVQWGRKHEFALANNLSFVVFDDAIGRRLPKNPQAPATGAAGPVKLDEFPLEEGWIGEHASWSADGKRPAIAAAKEFKGDRAKVCWLPSQRSAAVWQAFVGSTRDVTIAQPAGLGDGQKFALHSREKPVEVKATLAAAIKPAKVVLWDAHEKLAEKRQEPWAFEVPLQPGIHSLIVTVEDADGMERGSRPHTIVVE